MQHESAPRRPVGGLRTAHLLTLPQFYERYFGPCFLLGARPKTFSAYRESLKHWVRLTANPPLHAISVETLAAFKAGLIDPALEGQGSPGGSQMFLWDEVREEPPPGPLAKPTANKHLRHINAILAKAGPPGHRNREALGILDCVPWIRPFRTPAPRPRGVSEEILNAVYRACSVATYPKLEGVAAENWWKAMIVVACVDGFRRGGLLGLPWTAIDWQAMEIRLPADADKCIEERLKPMPKIVAQHLLRIRTPRRLIFEFPHSESTFYRQWRAIQEAAELPRAEWVRLHDLKRTCGTILARAKVSPWAIQKALDHASLNTSVHYINPADELRGALDAMPLPAAFVEDFSAERPARTG